MTLVSNAEPGGPQGGERLQENSPRILFYGRNDLVMTPTIDTNFWVDAAGLDSSRIGQVPMVEDIRAGFFGSAHGGTEDDPVLPDIVLISGEERGMRQYEPGTTTYYKQDVSLEVYEPMIRELCDEHGVPVATIPPGTELTGGDVLDMWNDLRALSNTTDTVADN